MAIMFGELGLKRGAEIGVRTGKYSEILCKYVKGLEKLYSIDPWDLVFEDRTSHKYGMQRQHQFYQQAIRRLRKYSICELVRKTSLEAVRDIEYNSLDFVYIDGAHSFDYAMTDIIEWSKRVRSGGIISGDDYKKMKKGNVIDSVNAYIKAHKIKILNIMIPKKNDDYPVPNWWFVK